MSTRGDFASRETICNVRWHCESSWLDEGRGCYLNLVGSCLPQHTEKCSALHCIEKIQKTPEGRRVYVGSSHLKRTEGARFLLLWRRILVCSWVSAVPPADVEKVRNLGRQSPRFHRPPSGLRQGTRACWDPISSFISGAEDAEDACPSDLIG